jgi:hypothetical protein
LVFVFAAYAPPSEARGGSAERRWPRASRLSSPFRLGISVIACDRLAANLVGGGLKRGWRGLEIDKTVVVAGLSAGMLWW